MDCNVVQKSVITPAVSEVPAVGCILREGHRSADFASGPQRVQGQEWLPHRQPHNAAPWTNDASRGAPLEAKQLSEHRRQNPAPTSGPGKFKGVGGRLAEFTRQLVEFLKGAKAEPQGIAGQFRRDAGGPRHAAPACADTVCQPTGTSARISAKCRGGEQVSTSPGSLDSTGVRLPRHLPSIPSKDGRGFAAAGHGTTAVIEAVGWLSPVALRALTVMFTVAPNLRERHRSPAAGSAVQPANRFTCSRGVNLQLIEYICRRSTASATDHPADSAPRSQASA